MIKSPLRYPGGKSRVAAKIASLIPRFDEFREPFVGGGSVFLYMKQKFPHKKYWINDKYEALYDFWDQSQKSIKSVISQVEEWRNAYTDGKMLHRFLNEQMPQFNELERASAFFIFNRITFSGTTEAGGYSEQAFQGRFTDSSIQRLVPFAKLLAHTQITNYDYEELIHATGKNVFLFLDPPYYLATKSALYGKNGTLHKTFDHERFAKNLKSCPHQWLITYDDSAYIRELFDFANITSWDMMYGMRNINATSNQKESELLISNFPIFETVKEELLLFAEPEMTYQATG